MAAAPKSTGVSQTIGNRDMAYGRSEIDRCWLVAMAYGCSPEIGSVDQTTGNRDVAYAYSFAIERKWGHGCCSEIDRCWLDAMAYGCCPEISRCWSDNRQPRHGLWPLLRNRMQVGVVAYG